MPTAKVPTPLDSAILVAALEQSTAGVELVDLDVRIRWVNQAFCRLTGYERQEIVGETPAMFRPQDAPNEPYAAMEAAVRGGADYTGEIVRRRKDGSTYQCRITICPVRVDGTIVGFCAQHEDISEQRRQLAQREESELNLRAVLEAIPDIVLVHAEGRVLLANAAARRFAERHVSTSVPARDAFLARLLGRIGEDMGVMLPLPSGGSVALEQRVVPVRFEGIAATLSILSDVAARQAEQARAIEADRLASMGMLAASVAHEINNPLTYALSNVELSLEAIGETPQPNPELVESLEQSRDGLLRVRDIVRDLRAFTRGDDHGASAVEVQPVVESVLRMAWGDLRHRAQVVRDLQPTSPVGLAPSRLAQVLLNLVMNAAQAIPSGNAAENEVRVVVRPSSAGGTVIEVHDSGPGIKAEDRARVFMPFVTTKSSGTGLGLPIVREIVESHGGVIGVSDRPGGGSIFRVVLPPARGEGGRAPSPGPQRQLGRLRILVVDDEPFVARVLARLLTPHEIVCTASPGEARALLSTEDFDAVFCDLFMPDMTGTDLLREVEREHDSTLHRKFVFMTGGTEHAVSEVLNQHPHPVLQKPFDRRSVRQALDHVLMHRSSAPPA